MYTLCKHTIHLEDWGKPTIAKGAWISDTPITQVVKGESCGCRCLQRACSFSFLRAFSIIATSVGSWYHLDLFHSVFMLDTQVILSACTGLQGSQDAQQFLAWARWRRWKSCLYTQAYTTGPSPWSFRTLIVWSPDHIPTENRVQSPGPCSPHFARPLQSSPQGIVRLPPPRMHPGVNSQLSSKIVKYFEWTSMNMMQVTLFVWLGFTSSHCTVCAPYDVELSVVQKSELLVPISGIVVDQLRLVVQRIDQGVKGVNLNSNLQGEQWSESLKQQKKYYSFRHSECMHASAIEVTLTLKRNHQFVLSMHRRCSL